MNIKKNIKKVVLVFVVSSSVLLSVGATQNWDDLKTFFSAIVRSPNTMGAVLPSSSNLAEKITRFVVCEGDPVCIIEVGAGTGSFTEKIIQKMRPQDRLDVIEIDPNLCEILRKKFGHHTNVRISCISFLDWNPDRKYKFVVSGVPHNSLSIDMLDAFLEKYKQLLDDGATLSFFEYIGVGTARTVFAWFKRRSTKLRNSRAIKKFVQRFAFDKDRALLNFPPAYAHHLTICSNN